VKPDPLRFDIRNYRPEDFPRLHQIDRICFPPDVAYSRSELLFYIKHPDSITRVASLGDRVIGFVAGRLEDDSCAHVLTLDVIPEEQRRKVGTGLMGALHEEFARRKVVMVFLEVDALAEGSRRFYENLGYRWVETLRRYYSARRDAHRMVCFLKKEPGARRQKFSPPGRGDAEVD
jgi:ribosomal-protein-alanine N-acetyltransferase